MTEDEIRRLGMILDEKLSGLESRVDEKLSGLERRVDEKLSGVDRRIDDLHRHFDVVAKSLTGQIQQVAEGVVLANDRLDRFEQRTATEFGEVKSMIRLSYAELERRLGTLESTVLDLAHRVETLERRSAQ